MNISTYNEIDLGYDSDKEYYVYGTFLNSYLQSKGFKHNRIGSVGGRISLFYDKSDELFESIEKYKADTDLQELIKNFSIVSKLSYNFKRDNK